MNEQWVELKIKEQENRLTALKQELFSVRTIIQMIEDKLTRLERAMK